MREIQRQEWAFEGLGGTPLRGYQWQPHREETSPRGVILILHGLGEHAGRYGDLAERLADQGYLCGAFDLRGHGRSGGPRGHVARFEHYLEDVELARRKLLAEGGAEDETPFFLLAHSMGGLIAIRYLKEHGEGVQGAVLSSPYLGDLPHLEPPAILRGLARLLSRLWPSAPFKSGLRAEHVSRDPTTVKAYREDPLIHSRVSPRWFVESRTALAQAHAAAPGWKTPMLLLQSGADLLVDPEATRQWAALAPPDLVDYVEWEGFFHEMFHELPEDREKAFQRVEGWLAKMSEEAAGT